MTLLPNIRDEVSNLAKPVTQSRTNGVDGTAHDVGDLVQAEPLEHAKAYDLRLGLRQAPEELFRPSEFVGRFGYVRRIVALGRKLFDTDLPERRCRTPLSKEILRGDWDPSRLGLRRKGYEELELELELGRRAVSLDPAVSRLELDDGRSLAYDGLVIATGAAPRRLPRWH